MCKHTHALIVAVIVVVFVDWNLFWIDANLLICIINYVLIFNELFACECKYVLMFMYHSLSLHCIAALLYTIVYFITCVSVRYIFDQNNNTYNDGNEDKRWYLLLDYFFLSLHCYWVHLFEFEWTLQYVEKGNSNRNRNEWFNQLFNCFSTTINHMLLCCAIRPDRSFIRITFYHPIRWNGKVICLLADRSCNNQLEYWTCFLKLVSFISFSHFFLTHWFRVCSFLLRIHFFSLHIFSWRVPRKYQKSLNFFLFNCDNNNDKLYSDCYYFIFMQQMQYRNRKPKIK